MAPLTTARAGEDLASALSECAEANAGAHLERWGIELLTVASPDGARIEWPHPADGARALPTVSIRRAGGWVRVHSGRQPLDEARRLVQQELGDRVPGVVCVIGAGLGYVVDVLLERGGTNVFVLEPEPALLPWLLARRDWRDAITSGRLLIVPGPGYAQRMRAWQIFTPVPESVPVVASRIICEVRPEAASAARDVLSFVLEGAAANQAAGERFQRSMLLNTLRNLPVIAREAPVESLRRLFAGRAAIVAGAGPSLNRNIEEVRPYRDRVVLVAVGTALKPLVTAGMPPDFVLAVDPGEFTSHQFAAVDVPATYLVAEPSVEAAVFEGFGGRTFLFRVGCHQPWAWLQEQGYDPGVIRTWGSVLTSALNLGVLLGCDPLVFIGADFAYTHGQSHANDTFTHDWVREWVAGGMTEREAWARLRAPSDLVVDGIGGRCPTSPTLVQFRDWVRHESCVLPTQFINATGAGILTGGRIATATLAETLGGRAALGPVARAVARIHDRALRESRSGLLAAVRLLQQTRQVPASWLEFGEAGEFLAAIGVAPC